MMKFSRGVVIVFCAVCAGAHFADEARAEAIYDGKDRIEVNGKGNTLSSIAADIAKADVFSYNAETRTATSTCGVFVRKEAELTMGKKGDAEAGEILRIVCSPELRWGSRTVSVEGSFSMYHSRLEGVGEGKETLKHGAYYEHLAMGELVDSSIDRAVTGVRMQSESEVAIRGLLISRCTRGLQVQSAAGGVVEGIKIEDTERAAFVQHSVAFRNCDFGRATMSIEAARPGVAVNVTCTDCDLDRTQVEMTGDVGQISVLMQWQQMVQLADEQDYPVPGAYVRLLSRVEGLELPARLVRTDAAGEAWVDVPECEVKTTSQGKVPETVPFLSLLQVNTKGTAEDGYRVLKKDWVCTTNAGLQFFLLGDGSVREQATAFRPGRSGTASGIVNLCPNSSFELETIKGFPDYWWSKSYFQVKEGGWGVLTGRDSPGDELVFYGIDRSHVVHGERSLQIPPGMGLYVRGVRVDFGDYDDDSMAYAVSFYAASDVPDNEFYVRAGGLFTSTFKLGPEMKPYEAIWRLAKISERKRARLRSKRRFVSYFMVANTGKGRVWLDAVQLERGDQVHPYVPDAFKRPRH